MNRSLRFSFWTYVIQGIEHIHGKQKGKEVIYSNKKTGRDILPAAQNGAGGGADVDVRGVILS